VCVSLGQAAFTEEGLSKLWNELVKDGEIEGAGESSNRKEEEDIGKARRSPFSVLLEGWTWGQETSMDNLSEALQALVTEQQDLSLRAAQSTLSLSRLNQRLVILERYFIALSRKGICSVEGEEEKEEEWEKGEGKAMELPESKQQFVKEEGRKKTSVRTPPEIKSSAATEGLAKVGARAALSFAFAFLKRAWRSGEDSDLCSEVLQEAYEILRGLPVALLFDSTSVSSIWLDVVDRSVMFLAEVCRGLKMEERKNVPLEDRQTALALLLELALQRGTLQHILGAVLLLLQLSGSICRYRCNKMQLKSEEEETEKKLPEYTKSPPPKSEYIPPSNENDRGYPLVPFLRRLGDIPTPQSPYIGFQKSDIDSSVVSPTKCYLEFLTLPNDDTTQVGLRQVATVTLSHLDRLAQPYSVPDVVNDGSDQLPSKVLHWGGDSKEGSSLTGPQSSEILVELGAKQIVASDKHRIVLTVNGLVYSLKAKSNGEYDATPIQFNGDVEIAQISLHPEGKHILALSQNREVYSWGIGENGQLGLGDIKAEEIPTQLRSLSGKNVVFVAAGGSHSAAITEDGALYTWGKGSYGRLGHGNAEDKNVPALVQALVGHKIVDVDCGSGDAHSLALEDNGAVWSWGDGDFGKLGRGGSDSCKTPKLITQFNTEIARVKCGGQFSVALSRDGKVFTW